MTNATWSTFYDGAHWRVINEITGEVREVKWLWPEGASTVAHYFNKSGKT